MAAREDLVDERESENFALFTGGLELKRDLFSSRQYNLYFALKGVWLLALAVFDLSFLISPCSSTRTPGCMKMKVGFEILCIIDVCHFTHLKCNCAVIFLSIAYNQLFFTCL